MAISQTIGKSAAPDAAAQVRRAKGLYAWLWLSPILTLTTLGFLASFVLTLDSSFTPYSYDLNPYNTPIALTLIGLAVAVSGLWHLMLLYWALDRQSAFVRWHGRQALLLAGARTAVALGLALSLAVTSANGTGGTANVLWFVALLVLWFFGTLWGRGQAAAGECSLMVWAGHGASLPLRVTPAMHVAHDAMAWGDTLHRQGHSAEAGLVFRKMLVSDATPEVKAQAAGRLPLPGQGGSSETADILVAMLRFSLDPVRRQAALAALEQAGLVEIL